MDLVSVIIPTFNRFKFLLNAIKSVKEQTYENIEIIVVNDCSTEQDYYTFDFNKEFGKDFYIIHLPKNSRSIFGKVCGGGNSRNIGMMISQGTYIAFLDDDDYFLPTKIEKQLYHMKEKNLQMSCTEGFIGRGIYDKNKSYQVYHYKGFYWNNLKNIKFKNEPELLEKMFKDDINIWGKEEIYTHNCIINGGPLIHKDLVKKAGYFPLKPYAEDWAYWKELIKYSNCLFIREPLLYIDINHGYGRSCSY